MHRSMSRGLLLASAPLLVASPAAAQRVRFHPAVELSAGYTDNVEFVGSQETSDRYGSVALEIPVRRVGDRGQIGFRYRPSYYRYREQDNLDHAEHRADLDWSERLGRRTSFRFTSNFTLAQAQSALLAGPATPSSGAEDAPPPDVSDPDLLLTRRTDRRWWAADASLTRQQSERWSWSLGASWMTLAHESIDDFDPTAPAAFQVEDRSEYGASVGGQRQLSRGATVGLQAGYREFQLDVSPDETSTSLSFTYGQRIGRHSQLAFDLGGARTEPDVGEVRNDFSGGLSLDRRLRRWVFGLYARHRPESGGHLIGTSTNTSAGLRIGGVGGRAWSWAAGAAYQRRDPSDPGAEVLDAVSATAQVERRFLRSLGARLGVDHARQNDAQHRSVFSGDVGLVWYPRGPETAL